MKQCPKCGSQRFWVTAQVAQDWFVDENGVFVGIIDTGQFEVTHWPDDADIWHCISCKYHGLGKNFNVVE